MNREIPAFGLDFFYLRGNGFKPDILTNKRKSVVDRRVKIAVHSNRFTGEFFDRVAQPDLEMQILLHGFKARQNGCLRFFLGHSADVDAVDRHAVEHGCALQDRVKLFPMQLGFRRYNGDLFRSGRDLGCCLGLLIADRSAACEAQNQQRRKQRQDPNAGIFLHTVLILLL